MKQENKETDRIIPQDNRKNDEYKERVKMKVGYSIIAKMLAIGIIVSLPLTATAQLYPLSENDWSNPEFVARYLGSYGVDSELNPEITPEESAIFQDLTPFIEDNVENGIFFLEPKITSNSSAALDYMLGQLYLENEQPEEAIRSYNNAIRKFPDFLRAYKNISIAYMQLNDCDGAMPHLSKVLELGKADGLTYGMLGYCHIEADNFSSAMSAYGMARLFEPDKKNWKVGYAQATIQAQKYQDTIVALREIVTDQPEDAAYLLLQTNAYLAVGRDDDAITNLELVSRLGASNGANLTLLGDLYMRKEIPELALRAYLAALDDDGRPAFSRASRAMDYFARMERWQNAEAYLNRLKSVYGSNLTDRQQVELIIMEAQILQGNGQYSNAAELLADAVTREPLHGKALLLLAQNNKFSGDYERAELYYDRAANIDGYAYESLTDNARMAVSFRRLPRALSLLRRANGLRPSVTLDNNIRILENAINAER